MTRDRAHKAAVRRRMAQTGEPYSVARRAVQADEAGNAASGPITIRYWLSRSFELEVDRDAWSQADQTTRARLLAASDPAGSVGEATTLIELIEVDLAERGPSAFAEPPEGARLPGPAQPDRAPRPDWEEQYYAEGAAAEGISVAEFKARQAYRRDMGWPGRRSQAQAPWPARQDDDRDAERVERTATSVEQALTRAEQAVTRAEQAQEQAELAQGEADLAQERADESRDRADEAADRISEADDMAEEAMSTGDHELQVAADRMREQALRAAERAEREAVRAQELADREQEQADREQEKADRAWERTEAAMSHSGGGTRGTARHPGRRGLPPLAPLRPAPPMPPWAPRPRH